MAWPRLTVVFAAACSLAACSQPESAQEPTAPKPAETAGGADMAFSPEALSADDMKQVSVNGELGCAFALEKQSPALLIARGNVGSTTPASGIIKIAGRTIPLKSREPSGFDGLGDGATFEGPAVTVAIERLSEDSPPSTMAGSEESPPYPAKMILSGEGGAENAMNGLWTCGP